MTTLSSTTSGEKKTLIIATRNSPLALWQAEYVKAELEKHHPGLDVQLLGMTTKGDQILDSPLAKIGGKGLFVKELEVAMLQQRADIAVHSMKDVPMEFPEGLGLQVICEREEPWDAFVSNNYDSIDDLPEGATVGSSSLRRQCQLRAYRPDLNIIDLRGNVNTRLRKLDEGQYDAIILAVAGLLRLEMADRIKQKLPPEISLPAVGQGAVGIECRTDDALTQSLLAPLEDANTTLRVMAERAMNETLEGGCQVPIAGFSVLENKTLSLKALVGSPDGKQVIHKQAEINVGGFKADDIGSALNQAKSLGQDVGNQLLEAGAREILAAVYKDKESDRG